MTCPESFLPIVKVNTKQVKCSIKMTELSKLELPTFNNFVILRRLFTE